LVVYRLGPSDLPLDARDAHFFARLFVVVEPFVVGEVDAGKLGAGLCSYSEELSLQPGQLLRTRNTGVVDAPRA
jgi:hypothetical protein